MNTLQQSEEKLAYHFKGARQHLIAACKEVALIKNEKRWRQSQYTSFIDYMSQVWGIDKDTAYDFVAIGEKVENSLTSENLNLNTLRALVGVKEQYRQYTLEALAVIPDKPTATAINRLAAILEEGVETGAFETAYGQQLSFKVLKAVESAYLLEDNESLLRQREHIKTQNPPTASGNGRTLAETLNYSNFAKYALAAPCSYKIYDSENRTRIVIEVSKQLAGV